MNTSYIIGNKEDKYSTGDVFSFKDKNILIAIPGIEIKIGDKVLFDSDNLYWSIELEDAIHLRDQLTKTFEWLDDNNDFEISEDTPKQII